THGFFFFFQAEDGIRDRNVTGVQTCALPISKAEDLIRPVAPTTQPKEQKPASAVTRVELPNGTVLLVKRITTTPLVSVNMYGLRSEERRVGKEWRSRGGPEQERQEPRNRREA